MKQDCQLFNHVVLVPPEYAAGVLTIQLRCSRGRQICYVILLPYTILFPPPTNPTIFMEYTTVHCLTL